MHSTRSTKLRVGVIGAGAFAEACHVPGLLSHPQAEVVAISGRRPERVQELATRFKIPHTVTEHEELCARRDIDAVTIVTQNVDHARLAIAALRSGKHVLCEKPMAINVEEAEDMVRMADASAKIHQVAFTYRYLFGVQELRRRVMQGNVGSPYYVRVQWEVWDAMASQYQIRQYDKLKTAGGGILYDVGSHLFDIAHYVLGPIKRVTGFTKLIPRQRKDRDTGMLAEVEVDDIAAAWFVHEAEVQGQLFASHVTPSSGEKAYIEVIGSKGALRAALSRGSVDALRASTPDRPEWRELPLPLEARDKSPHCLGLMMRSFVDACLRGKHNTEVDASFHEGLAAQRALAAVHQSSIGQAWVSIKQTL